MNKEQLEKIGKRMLRGSLSDTEWQYLADILNNGTNEQKQELEELMNKYKKEEENKKLSKTLERLRKWGLSDTEWLYLGDAINDGTDEQKAEFQELLKKYTVE